MDKPQNITILGAGIMGLMAAYTLADEYTITLYDPKGFPADNASLMAGGMLAPYSEIEHMDMDWVNAGLKSIDIWEGIDLDTGFIREGSLFIAHPEDRHILERFKSHLPSTLQTYQNVQNHEEQAAERFQNGLLLPDEAHLDPHKAMPALCEFLDKHPNVTLATQEPAASADLTIDCRGIDAKDKDLRGVKGEVLKVRNTDFTLKRPVRLMHPRYPLYIIPREEPDIFMIGATIIEASNNETVSLKSGMELMSALYSLHPSFADAEILEIKAGIRPSYPDNLPRITVSKDTISCNGLFRHGWLLSPVMAQCVKDHLAGQSNEFSHLFIKGDTNERDHQRAA